MNLRYVYVLLGGLVFGFGLALSGAAKPEIVLDFLQLDDFGLALVLAAAIAVTFLAYRYIPKYMKNPLEGDGFNRKMGKVNKETITGAVIFGVGWGLSGLCPGTVLAGVGMGNYPLLVGIAGIFLGTYLNGVFRK